MVFAALGGHSVLAQDTGNSALPPALPFKMVAGSEVRFPGWQRFQIGEPAVFTVSFPRNPQSASKRIEGNDTAGDVWLFFVANTTTLVSASYQVDDSGRSMTEHRKWVLFNNWVAGFTDSIVKNGTLGASGRASLQIERRIRSDSGIEGFERYLAIGGCNLRLQSFSVGPRTLILAAGWRASSPKSEPVHFFDSLTIDIARGSAEAALNSAPLANWKRHQIGDGSVSALLPKQPIEDKEFAGSGVDKKNGPAFFTAEGDDGLFGVGYLRDLPAGVTSDSERVTLYATAWRSFEDKLRQTLGQELNQGEAKQTPLDAGAARAVTVGGVPGEEKIFRSGGLELLGQLALSGRRMYLVLVGSTIETPLATRRAFLESLRLGSAADKPLPER